MPLTDFQKSITSVLALNRTPDSYLAGGAALHFKPNSKRFSQDLDYFHDHEERVARAFAQDRATLEHQGCKLDIVMSQPGYIRALVSKGKLATKIEWAHDSAWRFMPLVFEPSIGYLLHDVDLAINKVLALVGRDEVRDFVDTLYCDEHVLSLGAMCWAAAGKDPGFSPRAIVELLRRRGKYQPREFERLHLAESIDVRQLKVHWLDALHKAHDFVTARPCEEVGCLYWSPTLQKFVDPTAVAADDIMPHYGRPGGVIPTHK